MSVDEATWARLARLAEQVLRRAAERLPRDVAATAKVQLVDSPMCLMAANLTVSAPLTEREVVIEVVALHGGRSTKVESAVMRQSGRILVDFPTLELSPDARATEAEARVKAYLSGLEDLVAQAADAISEELASTPPATMRPPAAQRTSAFASVATPAPPPPEPEPRPADTLTSRSEAHRQARAARRAEAEAAGAAPAKKAAKQTATKPAATEQKAVAKQKAVATKKTSSVAKKKAPAAKKTLSGAKKTLSGVKKKASATNKKAPATKKTSPATKTKAPAKKQVAKKTPGAAKKKAAAKKSGSTKATAASKQSVKPTTPKKKAAGANKQAAKKAAQRGRR